MAVEARMASGGGGVVGAGAGGGGWGMGATVWGSAGCAGMWCSRGGTAPSSRVHLPFEFELRKPMLPQLGISLALHCHFISHMGTGES